MVRGSSLFMTLRFSDSMGSSKMQKDLDTIIQWADKW